ncbi:hypothetical protein SAICODRAFT_29768 [Saitoella complicata NRRL Y-17804]|nr:uncharacterized protein SAICODRAFT_29768 [Saitoella complicata NRRL Y-17804]ODQ54263.1 hypothetical protein SAICODRAFT_29768 [Saitoella complicata NRRL Y-17804]
MGAGTAPPIIPPKHAKRYSQTSFDNTPGSPISTSGGSLQPGRGSPPLDHLGPAAVGAAGIGGGLAVTNPDVGMGRYDSQSSESGSGSSQSHSRHPSEMSTPTGTGSGSYNAPYAHEPEQYVPPLRPSVPGVGPAAALGGGMTGLAMQQARGYPPSAAQHVQRGRGRAVPSGTGARGGYGPPPRRGTGGPGGISTNF